MGILELSCCQQLSSPFSISHAFFNNNYPPLTKINLNTFKHNCCSNNNHRNSIFIKAKIRHTVAVAATTTSQEPPSESTSKSETPTSEDPPTVNFAFVSSVLLPDGSPDVRFRVATGGQKLRNIMLDANVELYGPYARPLLNCAGGGTCGTCIVEVVEGKELLNRRTKIEKEKLKRNPKTWRLACQTMVGTPDSNGLLVIQQLPEWKVHEWNYGAKPPQLTEEESAASN